MGSIVTIGGHIVELSGNHRSLLNFSMVHMDFEFARNLVFFEGHMIMIPISSVVSIWWTLNILTNHHRERLSNGQRKFRSRLWYHGPLTSGLPLESVLKLVLISTQLLAQFVGCVIVRLPCDFHTHAQHAVLYVALFVASLVELMTHFRCAHLPAGVDRLANVVAYLVMTVVFVFHSGHASPLNDLMHSHLVPYLCVAVVVALLLEDIHPTNFVVALMRPYFVTVIGSWFLQLGYVLFPVFPWQTMPFDGHDSSNLNVVPLLLCFHLILALVLFLILNCIVVWRLNRRATSHPLKHDKCDKCQPLLMMNEHFKSHLSE